MALRQQPDRLKVPCRAGVGTASIPFLQLNNAQMIRHMCHGSPSAIHGTPIYMLRSILGIPDESITRNPYHAGADRAAPDGRETVTPWGQGDSL